MISYEIACADEINAYARAAKIAEAIGEHVSIVRDGVCVARAAPTHRSTERYALRCEGRVLALTFSGARAEIEARALARHKGETVEIISDDGRALARVRP